MATISGSQSSASHRPTAPDRTRTRTIRPLAAAIAIAIALLLPKAGSGGTSADGRQIAAWSAMQLVDPAGHVRAFRDFTKPVLLVNVWSSYCIACLAEFPSLQRYQAALGEGNVEVILVSDPMTWAQDQAYAKRHPLPFPIFSIAQNVPEAVWRTALRDYGTLEVPQTLIWSGSERTSRRVETGAMNWMDPALLRWTSTLLVSARTTGDAAVPRPHLKLIGGDRD
jgi:thiol-disulfide isomerase/thioredoxin